MKEAIENLLPLERNLFFALNGSESIFLDNMFMTITGKLIWAPILIFLVFMLFYKTPIKTAIITIVAIILLFTLCDQISSSLFKTYFQRLRPTYHPDFMEFVDTVKNYKSGGYSFISGHATNSFGIAVLLSLIFRSRWVTIPMISWALLNSYSRIYLGVHFITDILAGIIVGTLIVLFVYMLFKIALKRVYIKGEPNMDNSLTYTASRSRTIGIVFASYILFVIIFSPLLATLPL